MYIHFEKYPRRFALTLSLLAFILFASTTPKFNVGYGDSDEFIAIGKTWGLAHPPGYTLYSTLLHMSMSLPIPQTNATQRAHLLSGFLSSFSIYFTTLTLVLLTSELKTKKDKRNRIIRFTAIGATAISLTTSKLYWIYSQVAEKYILSALLISIIMYLSARMITEKKTQASTVIWIGLVYGALLSHHQSAVFLLPYYVYILIFSRTYKLPKILFLSILALIVGFGLPQILLLLRGNLGILESWYIKPGLQGVLDFITRADFRGTLYLTNTSTSGYFPNHITLNQLGVSVYHYLLTIAESFSWWIGLPVIVIIIHLWQKNKSKLLSLSMPVVLMGIALAGYLNWPTDLGSQATTIRFYIPSFVTFAPLICLGLIEIMNRLIASSKILGIKRSIDPILAIVLIISPILISVKNFPEMSMNKFDLVAKLYSSILNKVEPNSLVSCYSDSSCFALMYEQTVNGLRPDVQIVPLQYPLIQRQMSAAKLSKFSYDKNPYMMLDIVTWNIDKRPVYAVDISKYFFDLYGIDNGFMFYVPDGYAGKLTRKIPSAIAQYDDALSEKYIKKSTSESDLMQRFLIESLSQTHLTNGYALLKMGDRPKAQQELNTAVNLAYNLSVNEKKNALQSRTLIERIQGDSKYAPGSVVLSSQKVLSYLPEYVKQNKYNQALIVIRGALTIDPTNIEARLELARMYEKLGDPNFSRLEYRNILILDPLNQEAIQKVSVGSK